MKKTNIYEITAIVPLVASSADSAIRQLGEALFSRGFVKDTFVDAVLAREIEYPTGLPTPEFHVAIPHTDPEHVNCPAIALGVLAEKIEFQEMGNSDSRLPISLICMLAVTQADSLVYLLNELVTAFQDLDFLKSIIKAEDPDHAVNLFESRIYS